MRKTTHEIIDETVEFYSKNSRSINRHANGKKCLYLSKNGSKCAHSRCLTDEGLKTVVFYDNTLNARDVIEHFGDDIHKEEYKGHSPGFWLNIQSIHDNDDN